jgi:hypothetical protein
VPKSLGIVTLIGFSTLVYFSFACNFHISILEILTCVTFADRSWEEDTFHPCSEFTGDIIIMKTFFIFFVLWFFHIEWVIIYLHFILL